MSKFTFRILMELTVQQDGVQMVTVTLQMVTVNLQMVTVTCRCW
jgi:hypothetical protein